MNDFADLRGEITAYVPGRVFTRMAWAMLGPLLPPDKPAEIQRWEDDGGPLSVIHEGYTHIIVGGAVE